MAARIRVVLTVGLLIAALGPARVEATRILFDASHAQTAGNADWVLDEDTCDVAQRWPTPDQSQVDGSTPETFWSGAFSAFGIDLVKNGYQVESLPPGTPLTYGDPTNPQDLANYDILVLPEPNVRFTAAEKQAVLDFVNAGGGLLMIADHAGSDRNNDGWDSPEIFNDMGSETYFGIHFNVSGETPNWFDDHPDDNYSTDPADPIVHGPYGDLSPGRGLGLYGSTAMTLDTTANPTATGHIWKTGATVGGTTEVTFATAEYGAGRVAAIGDSSPAEDSTNDCGHTTYDGWTATAYDNALVFLNAIAWLEGPADTTPPVITGGPAAAPGQCTATVTWTTDEPATSVVEYGTTPALGTTASTAGYVTDHSVTLTGLDPLTTYHYRVSSTDAAGNGPTTSAIATFDTPAALAPVITSGPTVASAGTTSFTLTWTTDIPADSRVEYGLTTAYGGAVTEAELVTSHSVTVTGLSPGTAYHVRVGSNGGCGTGPVWSGDVVVATAAGGGPLDISGWSVTDTVKGYTFTFPAGTVLDPGDVVVIGRKTDRAGFESGWGVTLGSSVHYFRGSDQVTNGFPQINDIDRRYELRDDGGTVRDGETPSLATYSNTNRRTSPADDGTLSSSWTTSSWSTADPGTPPAAAGTGNLVISEFSDNRSDHTLEFLELYYDAAAGGTPPDPPATLTTTARSDRIALEWITAQGADYAATRVVYRSDAEPADANDGTVLADDSTTPAGSYASAEHTGVTSGTTYRYAAFTRDASGAYSGSRVAAASPVPAGGKLEWRFATPASALAPPGVLPGAVGSGAVYAVSNDRRLHAMEPGSSGGRWPRGGSFSWLPPALNAPAQHRPPVVPLGSTTLVYLAAQDGRAYAVNAHDGSLAWSAGPFAPALTAGPVGLFSAFDPGAPNRLFVGTRDPGGANRIVALDPLTGAEDSGRGFGNETGKGGDGRSMGIVTGLLADYGSKRIYVTTRRGGADATVWCVDVAGSTAQLVWSAAVGDVDAAPSLRSGVVYVGTVAGEVVALDAATGAVRWTYATGDGPVKAVVWPSFSGPDLYAATTGTLWALTDGGGSVSVRWSTSAVPSPSSPLERLGSGRLLVGGGDGRLYEVDAASGGVLASVAVASGQVGSPALDVASGLALVGAEDGTVSAVAVPLAAAPSPARLGRAPR